MSFIKSQTTTSGQPVTNDNSPYVRASAKTVGLMLKLHGGEFEAAVNTTTKHQMKFTKDIEIVGAIFQSTGANNGDKVNVKIVDVDNIIGYGPGVVLAQFAVDVPGHLCQDVPIHVESSTSDTIMEGLYLSMEYTNASLTETVDVHYSWKYYS